MTTIDRAVRPAGDLTAAASFDGGQPSRLFGWSRADEPVSPDLEPDGPASWLPSTSISGPRTMPVRSTPGPRSSS